MSWRSRSSRILKRVLVAVAALVLFLLLLVSLTLGTRPGRNLLLVQGLTFVNDAIPGRIQVVDFKEFSFTSLEFGGIAVFDPAGTQVLALRTLRLEGDWLALRADDLRVTRARLHDGFVDVSSLDQERRGLVAAFVDPNAPPSPPSTTPPPYVLVKAIELDALAVRLPRPSAAVPDELRRFGLRGSFELDGTPRAQVESLSFDILRGAEQIGRLTRLKARLGRGSEPSNLTLAADLAGARLDLSASGVAPPARSWQSAPLKARVKLWGVTSERIARLAGDDSLGRAFLGAVELDLGISGSTRALTAKLELDSAAGELEFGATLADSRDLRFELETAGLVPSRLVLGAPAHTVVAVLGGRVDVSQAPASFRVHELKLRDASIDGEELPRLDAAALVSQRHLKQLKLEVADAASHLRVAGDAGFDGSAKLDVTARIHAETLRRVAALVGERRRLAGALSVDLEVQRSPSGRVGVKGNVDGQKLVFDTTSLGLVAIAVDLAGEPPELAGTTEVRIERLVAGDTLVSVASFQVRGGPRQYALALRARSNQGDVDLTARLAREKSGTVLVEGKGTGTRSGQPLVLDVRPTRVGPAGSVATEGVRLRVAGQELEVRGSASPSESALEVEAREIDLAALNPLLASKEKLQGKASLQAALHGSWQRPDAVVLFEGRGLALGERPKIDVSLSAQLTAAEGLGQMKLSVRDVTGGARGEHWLVAGLDAETRFSPRAPLVTALESAEYRGLVEVEKLDLAFVQAHLPRETTLPVAGKVTGKLELGGRLSAPLLALHVDAELDPTWSKRRLEVSHDLVLESGRLAADLQISDEAGVWADVNATTSLPPFEQLSEQAARLAQQERWRLELTLAERELEHLPIPEAHRRTLPGASIAGSLDAAHEPGQEPELDLALVLRQKRELQTALGCTAKDLRVDTDISMARGEVAVRLLARQAQRELVNLDAKARLLVANALGGGKPELGRITANLKSSDLELRTLPFVCQRFGGRVNLRAHIDDPLGERPDVALALTIGNLTAGSKTSVDTSLDLFVKPDQAGLDAKVRHGVNTSVVALRLPVELGGGRLKVDDDAALRGELRLRHLPIEPFLDPDGAISYATGTLSGQAKVSGTLKAPRVRGSIDFEKLGFTLTDMAQPLRNVEGQVRFTEQRVELKGFEAHDNDGVLEVDGSVDFANLKRIQGDFRVRAREFPMRQQGQIVATTDVDARIKSTLTPRKSHVKILLRAVDTWLETAPLRQGIALAGHRDVVVNGQAALTSANEEPSKHAGLPPPTREGKAPANTPAARDAPAKVTEIMLDARDKFWVKRDDFAVKLAALVTARIVGEAVWVEGNVEIDRGYLQLFGKVFEIERGSELEFIGSPEPDPVLDIRAIHENRRSGQSVKVQITGRGSAPVLTFFVDDVIVTAGDAFVALFGAQKSNEDPDAAGDQAKNFVGGLTAGVLATAARRELGAAAPILMVEPGGGSEETRVRAGFELDSIVPRFLRPIVTGMYFEGIVANDQSANTQDANVHGGALLEIYFPRDLFTTGQYGPGTTWSIDLGWQL